MAGGGCFHRGSVWSRVEDGVDAFREEEVVIDRVLWGLTACWRVRAHFAQMKEGRDGFMVLCLLLCGSCDRRHGIEVKLRRTSGLPASRTESGL